MTLLKLFDVLGMILLLLGELTIKVAVEFCNQLLMRCLKLPNLLSMLGL